MKRFFTYSFLLHLVLLCARASAQEGPVIQEIRIRGNDWVETSFIESQSGLFKGQNLAEGEAARVIRNLYKSGLFSDIKIFWEQVPGGVAVIIDLKAVPRLGEVIFKGNRAIKDKTLKRELELIEKPVDTAARKKEIGRQNWSRSIEKKGYLLASVDVKEEAVDGDGRLPLTF